MKKYNTKNQSRVKYEKAYSIGGGLGTTLLKYSPSGFITHPKLWLNAVASLAPLYNKLWGCRYQEIGSVKIYHTRTHIIIVVACNVQNGEVGGGDTIKIYTRYTTH